MDRNKFILAIFFFIFSLAALVSSFVNSFIFTGIEISSVFDEVVRKSDL